MEPFTVFLTDILFRLIELAAVIIELWGLFIIMTAIVKEIYRVLFRFRLNFKKINEDNSLNGGLASALEVLLAAEILKTITVDDYRNLIIIGILIFLRIAMAMLLVWEAEHKGKAQIEDS